MTKDNLKTQSLGVWNEYLGLAPDAAASKIHTTSNDIATKAKDWYWGAIRSKKLASLGIRFASLLLLAVGVALPLIAAVLEKADVKLALTQAGIVVLAIAGVLQTADKVLGLSSGWLRYIVTVTEMETVSRQFNLDWARFLLAKTGNLLTIDDALALFDMAKALESHIAKLRIDETEKWVVDFNGGLALLSDQIKSHRVALEKLNETHIEAVKERDLLHHRINNAETTGEIEVLLDFGTNAVVEVELGLDDSAMVKFTGTSWAISNVKPGPRTIRVKVHGLAVERIVRVEAGKIENVTIKIPH